MRAIYILLCALLALSACRSTVTTMKADTDQIRTVDPSMGYLLMGVETNSDLKHIDINGPTPIRLTHTDLKEGTSYILIPLAAGEYSLSNVQFNSYYNSRMKNRDIWQFEIKQSTVSYVGHLEVKTRGFFVFYSSIELVNRSTEALDFMHEDFPSILNNRVMYYGGPGEDTYFQFVNGLGE